jgi:hypothetical protein
VFLIPESAVKKNASIPWMTLPEILPEVVVLEYVE